MKQLVLWHGLISALRHRFTGVFPRCGGRDSSEQQLLGTKRRILMMMSMHRRILLVEDSRDILYLMKTELEFGGYIVDDATDAYEGLRLARMNRPDVIISDIQMPGLDGFEFVRRVRQTPHLAGIPAIALSGFDFQADDKARDGFSAFVIKPVDSAELIQLIRRLTARKKQAA